jgi:hypothetical protein
MQPPAITKYRFSIRSRSGVGVDNLSIAGRDEAEARRKLMQIYPGCEVLECNCQQADARPATLSYEDVASLISR